MLIVQFSAGDAMKAGLLNGGTVHPIAADGGLYALGMEAAERGEPLATLIEARLNGAMLPLAALADAGRLLPPILHPDPSRLIASGTGLTHLGSANQRDAMHKAKNGADDTDTMRMFRMGLERVRPPPGEVGVAPEWFYKGDGQSLVAPGAPLPQPDYAADGGEEPEIAVVYLIDATGTPRRIGTAIANEFSDHVTERTNYLWLAHSKLRGFSIGPALRLGDLPARVDGVSRIVRDGATLWEKPFLSGADRMSHSLENIEYHHFKYAQFRRPGDVHIHFLGTATLSFADGVATQPGDRFEIAAQGYGPALVNPIVAMTADFAPGDVGSLYN